MPEVVAVAAQALVQAAHTVLGLAYYMARCPFSPDTGTMPGVNSPGLGLALGGRTSRYRGMAEERAWAKVQKLITMQQGKK